MSILMGKILKDETGKRIGREASEPCPDVLTCEEAARYLRLDETEIKNPDDTLRRYRDMGLLKGTQIGKAVRYRRCELERFLDRQTEATPV